MNELALALIICAICAFAASAVLYLMKKEKAATAVFIAAWCFNAALFTVNWIIAKKPPFANMYHVLSVLPLFLLPARFYMKKASPDADWLTPVYPGLALIPLIGCVAMRESASAWSSPVLDSVFFVPHVISYCISYSLCGIAFILGVVYFFDRSRRSRYLSASHELIRLAMPFMTLGLSLGAIWAEEAWGTYWSWDAKETFALVTWLIYLAFLHLMRTKHKDFIANIVNLLGFIALLGTFLGVNLLDSIHAYALG